MDAGDLAPLIAEYTIELAALNHTRLVEFGLKLDDRLVHGLAPPVDQIAHPENRLQFPY